MALILITHDLGVVAGMCDRVAVMYAGYIVEQAPTGLLYGDPRHPYTLGLLRSVPRVDRVLEQELFSIEGAPPDLANLPLGCPFAPRCAFFRERCQAEMPPLVEVSAGHTVRCWVDVRSGDAR
jgi:oligopeptide transport system ATP-binding protein